MSHIILSIDTDDLHPTGALTYTNTLLFVLLACTTIAVAIIIITVLLSKPKREKPAQQLSKSAHATGSMKQQYMNTINDICEQYHAQTLTREDAFEQLASLCRTFASHCYGQSLNSATLAELPRSRDAREQHNFTLLRTTISALYPPEFADAQHHPIAKNTSVDQAADWVRALIERWR